MLARLREGRVGTSGLASSSGQRWTSPNATNLGRFLWQAASHGLLRTTKIVSKRTAVGLGLHRGADPDVPTRFGGPGYQRPASVSSVCGCCRPG
jgi:hypothetical protein